MKMIGVLMMAMACSGVPDARQSAPATAGGVTLSAEAKGDEVVLTLTNQSAEPVGYNLCSSRLMRRSGETWTNVPTGVMCTMEIRTLAPGASDTFTHTRPSGLASGQYRYETRVEIPMGGPGDQVASNSFELK